MFGSKNREDPNRKAFRQEFEEVCRMLDGAEHAVQMAVGHAINMANSIFHRAYSSPSQFQRIPKSEQMAYINKLTQMENDLRDKQGDPHASLGFGLFKMWVGALSENDTELVNKFGSQLSRFSQLGDLGG